MKGFRQLGAPPEGRGGTFLEHWRIFDEDWQGLSREYRPHVTILCKIWCEIQDVEEILGELGRNEDRSVFYMRRWERLNGQYMSQIQKLRDYIGKRSPGARKGLAGTIPTADEIPEFGEVANPWAH